MKEGLTKARLMARIAGPLLSATIRSSDWKDSDPEALAQRFADDINRVVPLAHMLVEILKPATDEERAAINALAAPMAAGLVAAHQELFTGSATQDVTRLLKPSINVLASFCDTNNAPDAGSPDTQSGIGASMIAMSPIIGCLSRYAFGKSPAKRLTDTLDAYSRAKKEVLAALPKTMRHDAALNLSLQQAAAQLFAAHFNVLMETDGIQDQTDAQFKELLAQWSQSLSLLSVLLRHAALDDEGTAAVKTGMAPANSDREQEDEDGEAQGGSGSGGGVTHTMQAGYNPMSFFKKGV